MSFPLHLENPVLHRGALEWRSRLLVAHGVGWRADFEVYASLQAAVEELFAGQEFPREYTEAELRYERDSLGKPFVTWRGKVAAWAAERGLDWPYLQVSNTHDGGAHIVLAAYHTELAGIGIDAVYLPRLRQEGKGADYLRRFAARFMSERERAAFEQGMSGDEDVETLRLRTTAHFSLMEAASKALGTGLKIGIGMGRDTSLPKQSIGALSVEPEVQMLFESEAQVRLEALDAGNVEACWSADETFLISVVLLWRKV